VTLSERDLCPDLDILPRRGDGLPTAIMDLRGKEPFATGERRRNGGIRHE